ncbi:RNA helicase [Lithohypha guttulata]|nr:RNA helicase [Lithohypha guttulata]
MQAWHQRPMQCVLCTFRRIAPSARRISSSRTLSLEIRRQKIKPAAGFDRRERDHKRQDSAEPVRGKHGQPVIRKYGKGDNISHLSDAEEKQKQASHIQKNIQTLEHRLRARTPTVSGNGTTSDMDRLDPTGQLWPAYRAYILSLKEKVATSKRPSNDQRMWDTLSSTNNESLEKELYFGFLDFAIKPPSADEFSKSKSMPVDLRYPTEWYASARRAQRVIHLHVGPTNSGKTYNALKRLQETKNGFYAGPLRLLAHEVYSRFRANGIACDLVTGDDVRLDEDADTKVYASTVEMVNTSRHHEVAVIDEIQMMGSEDRGWAWTRAFLGANANEVHLCGEERVVPLIRELCASMGDALQIHQYKRLNPLRCMSRSLRGNIKLLRKGDCVVAFSIMELHALRRQIELETNRRCAIVYGSLPPETRAQQADLFNDPDNDYDFLVASDAIGMGLNLSVKRIIFSSTSKFDGTKTVQLTIPQIKQIAGRAGRYRSAHQDKNKTSATTTDAKDAADENVGLVTCIDETDLPIIRDALATEAPPMRKAGIVPPAEYLQEYSTQLPPGIPFEYLMRKVSHAATIHPRFFLCDIRDKLKNARIVDDVPNLTIEQRVNITAAPLGGRDPKHAKCLQALSRVIAQNKLVTVADIPEIPLEVLAQEPQHERRYLEELESLHKCLILYLWLSYRFTAVLRDQPMAAHAKDLTEQRINLTLRAFSANPRLRQRLRKIKEQQKDFVAPAVPEKAEAQATAEPTYDPERQSRVDEKDRDQYEDNSNPFMLDGQADETVEEHFREPASMEAPYGAEPGSETQPDSNSLTSKTPIHDTLPVTGNLDMTRPEDPMQQQISSAINEANMFHARSTNPASGLPEIDADTHDLDMTSGTQTADQEPAFQERLPPDRDTSDEVIIDPAEAEAIAQIEDKEEGVDMSTESESGTTRIPERNEDADEEEVEQPKAASGSA